MQTLIKEALIISSFILLCILDKINIPFMGIITMLAFVISIGLLIYIGITKNEFKIDMWNILFSIYYKTFFLTALYFAFKDYPGKDIMSITAISFALLYILFAIIRKIKKEFIFSAILYINLFCGFFLLASY